MLLFSWLLFCVSLALALEIFSPKKYKSGDKVELLVNKIESDHTQLPYRYHNLPFVCNDPTKKAKKLLLGEILRGDRFWESNYDLRFGVDQDCARLCDVISRHHTTKYLDSLIKDGYVVHWNLDGLPGATTYANPSLGSKYYAAGFPLGFVKEGISYMYNHVTLVIRYHRDKEGLNAIVGFEVYPKSVNNEQCPGSKKNYKNLPLLKPKKGQPEFKTIIPYTYSVYWRQDNSLSYENRWDLYYDRENSQTSSHIHWLSFINSLVLVCLVSLIVAVIMFRVLKSDMQSEPTIPYIKSDVDGSKASGSWKRLVNVMMQKPKLSLLLSALCASGIQFLVAALGVVGVFVINNSVSFGVGSSSKIFFNNHQGSFFSCSVVLLVASGFVSSFVGIITHKLLLNETHDTVYLTGQVGALSIIFSAMFPLSILICLLFINLFVWAKESSNALPFGTILVLIFLFALVELPLGILGGQLGNRFQFPKDSFLVTSSTPNSTEERTTVRKSLIMNTLSTSLLFGVIPFGIVYVDLLLIFNSIWLEKTTFFYMYGFLLTTSIILLVVVSESAIVATYVSLTIYNNPNWQWLCFRVGSSIGWYIFAYSTYYFVNHLHMSDLVSILIYFSYMALVSLAIGVGCGAMAVLSGLLFIRKICSSVKLD